MNADELRLLASSALVPWRGRSLARLEGYIYMLIWFTAMEDSL